MQTIDFDAQYNGYAYDSPSLTKPTMEFVETWTDYALNTNSEDDLASLS